MYNIERTFYSVGQALFCRETVNNRTIVYDCGGQTKPIVKRVIFSEYPHKGASTIDALFISHYDRDHINGVFYLLNQCKVTHLILPMVSPLSRLVSFYGGRYSLELERFYAEPRSYIQQRYAGTHVHYVAQTESSEQANEPTEFDRIDDVDESKIIQLRFRDNPDWIYVPYNRKVMTSIEEHDFIRKLRLPLDATFDEILSKWKQQDLSFKRIVKEMGIIDIRKINNYSMTLYSGSIHERNACLFLGDYNACYYFKELNRAYASLWGNIRMIQVPHHGSVYNYSCGLCQRNTEYVVSNNGGPYKIKQVDPTEVVWHINNVTRERCYITDNGHVVLH